MKHYEYNFTFIAEWLESHPKMKYKVAAAIGTSASSLDRWIVDLNDPYHLANRLDRNGKEVGPINIDRMLAFCNHFDVDISNFFLQSSAPVAVKPEHVQESIQEHYNVADTETYTPVDRLKDTHEKEQLRLRLEHAQEIQRLHEDSMARENTLRREYQQREDQMRRDYEARIEELKDMVRDGMQITKMALTQSGQIQDGNVSEYLPGIGVSDYGSAPRPSVSPKKR